MLLPLFQQISFSCYFLGTCWPCGAGRRGAFQLLWSRLSLRHVLCIFLVMLLRLPMAVNFALYFGEFCVRKFCAPPPRAAYLYRSRLMPVSCPSPTGRGFFFFYLPSTPMSLYLCPGGNQQSLLHLFQYLMTFISVGQEVLHEASCLSYSNGCFPPPVCTTEEGFFQSPALPPIFSHEHTIQVHGTESVRGCELFLCLWLPEVLYSHNSSHLSFSNLLKI